MHKRNVIPLLIPVFVLAGCGTSKTFAITELEVVPIKIAPTEYVHPCGGVQPLLDGNESFIEELSDVVVPFKEHGWTISEVSDLIKDGYFSWADFNYLTAIGHESYTSYDGAYAVMCCVMNRLTTFDKYNTIQDVVTEPGQFVGFHDPFTDRKSYYNYCTPEVIDAAVNVLLGGESTIGDACYFYGKITGYDVWADEGIESFYNYGNNIFYSKGPNGESVHNMDSSRTSRDVLIYDSDTATWHFESGDYYECSR